MLKAFLFPLTISLLVLLGAASPVVGSHTLSHRTQARQLTCHTYFGQGIEAGDCAWALEKMGRMPVTTIDQVTGETVTFRGVFGRGMSDDRFRMPQRFVVGTCAIIMDMSDPRASLTSTWTLAGLGAHDLVTNCVLRTGVGGLHNGLGFDTVLINPLNHMNEQTRALWDRCSGLIDGYDQLTKPMATTPCIPADADAVAARMRAGLGRIKTE